MKNESVKKAPMTIARLGAAAGVGVETVRYYQRRGLLAVPASAGAVRRYDGEDVRRLLFIRRAQAADARIAELETSRAALERLRATCASGKKGPCPILEAFDGA